MGFGKQNSDIYNRRINTDKEDVKGHPLFCGRKKILYGYDSMVLVFMGIKYKINANTFFVGDDPFTAMK